MSAVDITQISGNAATAASSSTASAAAKRLMLAFLVTGFSALMIGASIGPLQALNYAGINLYPVLEPVLKTYYQGLTIHGVLNAYVFTFFVTAGLLVYLPSREMNIAIPLGMWSACYALMGLGTLMLLVAMFDNSATVLWTFYPPLKGSAFFYIGMTLLALGSVVPLPILVLMRDRWRKLHPGEVTPLVTYMSLITMLMWGVSSVGVVTELVVQLVPWSLGWLDAIDPMIARTLFWLTGHPIVYFWLMPAYVSWYGLLPRQAGGKLASDTMARITFVMLFIFSLPVGSHHQFADPGFSPIWRGILTALTMSVALPSLITAFTIGLSLEYAGRRRGGRGIFGWFTALPWGDPVVAAQVFAALTYIVGGSTGLVNGSWQLDNIVHNTTYLPGHFHLTVGSATALTFMSLAFWMVPHLSGRALISRRLALAAVWFWFVGISLFAIGMLWSGLFGVPRRAWVSSLPSTVYDMLYGSAKVPLALAGLGGAILWIAVLSFYILFFASLFFGKRTDDGREVAFTEVLGADHSSRSSTSAVARTFDHIWIMTLLVALATLAAYIPIFWPFLQHPNLATGWRVW